MLTLLLIITFTNIRFISGVENNDTTFINSLTDKQKKEFLQKVEKRINEEVPEVKSPEGNDTNVELYEKQLEDQGKSIQKLLRSEIDSLKTHPRRNANDTDLSLPSAHVDLTLRTHDEETEASRRGIEGKKVPKKSILLQNIPVQVQYDSEKSTPSDIKNRDARADKNESKSDVITWENTSHVVKIVDKNNTSEERKLTGRRSNDFDISLNKLDTTEDPSSSTNTDAVVVTTSYSLISNNVNSIATTKVDEDFRTKRNSDTSTSVHDVSTVTVQELTLQTEKENSRTTQGNKNTTIVAVDGKSVDYFNLTHNNANITSAINYSTPSIGDGSFNIKNANEMRTTTSFDKKIRIGDEYSNTTHYTDSSQTNSADISTTQDNHGNSTILNNYFTTNVTADNDSANMGNTTVDEVTSSKIFIQVYSTANRINSSTFKSAQDNDKIHNVSTQADIKYRSLTKDDLNTNNILDSKMPTAVEGVTHQNHLKTKYDNLTEIIDNQSHSTKLRSQGHKTMLNNVNDTVKLQSSNSKLDDTSEKVNNIHGSTTTDNIQAVIYNVSNSTILSSVNTNEFSKRQSIIVSSNTLDDVEEQPRSTYVKNDSPTVANVNETADKQKHITKLGNDKVDKTKIVTGLGTVQQKKTITDTETHTTYIEATTSSFNVSHNNQNKNVINNDSRLNTTALSPKKDSKKSTDTFNHSSLKVRGAYKIGPNSLVSVNETQPKFVPVYNYDPENAYFNPNIERPDNNGIPAIIKQTERHSKTSTLDIYLNGNKQSLRIKDVKERVTSAANAQTKQNLDLYDMMSADGSAESAKDEASYEKPLKHSLAKIRKKVYKHRLKFEDNRNNEENSSRNGDTNEKKKYSTVRNKYEEKDIIELFKNFGTLFKKEDRADDNEKSSENKENSNERHDPDKEIYKDVANSLENYNKVMKNKGIQQIVERLTDIQNQLSKKELKHKSSKSIKGYQSRFQVKDRERKHKKEETDGYSGIGQDTPFLIGDENLEYEDVKFVKPKKIKIEDDYVDLHVHILKDLVNTNDAGLKQYDWLGSTVLIQSGLEKLLETVDRKMRHKRLHPKDEELLEFSMNIHRIAITLLAEEYQATPAKRKRLSFRIPKPKKGTKNFNALNRMYGEMKKTRAISLIRSNYGIEDFKEFLDCLRSCLNDFHTAIKEISRITTYKRQRWFKNIKQLYLTSATEKEYLELLLHLITARLIGLIEEREKKMEGDDYNNDREADRIGVEFVMTVRICSELDRLNQ